MENILLYHGRSNFCLFINILIEAKTKKQLSFHYNKYDKLNAKEIFDILKYNKLGINTGDHNKKLGCITKSCNFNIDDHTQTHQSENCKKIMESNNINCNEHNLHKILEYHGIDLKYILELQTLYTEFKYLNVYELIEYTIPKQLFKKYCFECGIMGYNSSNNIQECKQVRIINLNHNDLPNGILINIINIDNKITNEQKDYYLHKCREIFNTIV